MSREIKRKFWQQRTLEGFPPEQESLRGKFYIPQGTVVWPQTKRGHFADRYRGSLTKGIVALYSGKKRGYLVWELVGRLVPGRGGIPTISRGGVALHFGERYFFLPAGSTFGTGPKRENEIVSLKTLLNRRQ